MRKENEEGNRAKGIATIIMVLAIIAGISWYIGCWYALFLVFAGILIWWMCFSKVYTAVTKKKISMDSSGCVGFIVTLVFFAIEALTNQTVALVILASPVAICALWILWKIIVVVLESLGILIFDAYDDDKK